MEKQLDLEEHLSRLDEHGREIPDPTPVTIPSGFRRPPTLQEQVQRLVRGELSRRAAEQGFETFEDADDFDVEGDEDPHTPFETHFDPVLGKEISPAEFKAQEARYREEYLKAQQRYFALQDAQDALSRRPARQAEPAKPATPAQTDLGEAS